MKPFISYSLLAAAAACGMAFGQAFTTPVGYVTQPLPPNQFTLAGLTVQHPTVASGVLDSATTNSVVDGEVDFTSVLTAGATYVLEITSGSGNGVVQEISAWSASTLTTPQDISASVTGGVTTYKLRKASTVSDVFGTNNTVGLTASSDGSPDAADKILIPNETNGLDTVFYFNDGAGVEGWLDSEGNLAADKVILYPDGFFVQRVAGTTLNLVISGEVKTTKTSGVLLPGFNYLNSTAPVGLTLNNSNLKAFVSSTSTGDPEAVDNVLIPNASGGYVTTFYFNDGSGVEGWLDGEGNLAGDFALEDGFLILNRGATKAYTLDVPASFSSL